MERADGWTNDKEIGIASESGSIYWFSSTHTHTHTLISSSSHSCMSAVPMATCVHTGGSWTLHCVCPCVLHRQAGGNINDLYLWQHQRQGHQYTPIRKITVPQSIMALCVLCVCACVCEREEVIMSSDVIFLYVWATSWIRPLAARLTLWHSLSMADLTIDVH